MALIPASTTMQARLGKASQNQTGIKMKRIKNNRRAERLLLEEFCKTSSHYYFPTEAVQYSDYGYLGEGGYGTVRAAELFYVKSVRTDGGEKRVVETLDVACKEIREVDMKDGNLDPYKRLVRELHIWSKLKHGNILTFLGFTISERTNYPTLISEIVENGDLRAFLEGQLKETPQKDIDYLSILKGIAAGLDYLHSHEGYYSAETDGVERSKQGIIHGDVKCRNILMSEDKTPLLADFGLAHVLNPGTVTIRLCTDGEPTGTANWMAVELLNPDESTTTSYTKESDIWAFGMTVYEVVTAKNPYYHLKKQSAVILKAVGGEKPIWPQDISPDCSGNCTTMNKLHKGVRGLVGFLKELCMACWNKDPKARPSMKSIRNKLDQLCVEF